jgi:hypothetical protein
LEEVRQKVEGFSYQEQQQAEGKKRLLRKKFFITDYPDMILHSVGVAFPQEMETSELRTRF